MKHKFTLAVNPTAVLSPRELQIFKRYGEGIGNNALAEELIISVKTITAHLTNIGVKLGLHSTSELRCIAALMVSELEMPKNQHED